MIRAHSNMLFVAFCALATVLSQTPLHAQAYDLRELYRPGQVIVAGHTAEFAMSMGGGADSTSGTPMHVRQRVETRYRVLRVEGGHPTLVQAYVVSAQETDLGTDKPGPVKNSPLTGKVVLIHNPLQGAKTFSFSDGSPAVVAGKNPNDLGTGDCCSDVPFGMLTNAKLAAAKIGDEWDDVPDMAKRNGTSKDELATRFRLEEVLERNGRRIAHISARTPPQAAGAAWPGDHTKLSAEYYIDLDRHIPHYLKADIGVDVPASPEMPLSMKMIVKATGSWDEVVE